MGDPGAVVLLGYGRLELAAQISPDRIVGRDAADGAFKLALVAAVEQCKRSPAAEFAACCDAVTGTPGTFARWQAQVARQSCPAFFAPVSGRLRSGGSARPRSSSSLPIKLGQLAWQVTWKNARQGHAAIIARQHDPCRLQPGCKPAGAR